MKSSILDSISSPEDLKNLSFEELGPLCTEIRQTLIQTTAKSGGHLASNLGTVELTVALHRVFDCPQDQIVWDVGHQCYTHKLLTGRKDQFSTLRQEGGLSGFPKRKESVYDAFVAGHSSTSISVASGLARAKSLQHDNHHVIAVIGDGAFTSGLAFEGANNAARFRDNLIVILNDNKMSISKNVGSFSKYLSKIRSRPAYFKTKDTVESVFNHVPLVGKPIARMMLKNAPIVILDEATAMLDPRGRKGLMRVCHELHDRGMTVVMITHFMEEAAQADRVIVLEEGRVACDGTPQDVLVQAELLEHLNLDLPFAAELSLELGRRGVPVGMHIETTTLKEELCRLLSKA